MAVIRTSRRTAGRSRAAVAALVAVGVTVLAGCQAGQQAQTANEIPTIDGASAQVGPLALRNITIEYPPTGSWPRGSDARVRLIVVNEGLDTDRLVEVRTDVAERVTLSEARPANEAGRGSEASPSATPTATPSGSPSGSGSPEASGSPSATASASAAPTPTPTPTPTEAAETAITIPAAGLVKLREDGPEIMLSGLTRELRPGQVVPMTFVFEKAGEVTVRVAVATPDEEVDPAPTVPVDGEAG